jgi:hypothetical protein
MPSPWKSPSGVFYLRERVPRDIASKAAGATYAFTINGTIRRVKAGAHIKVSLDAREPWEAKARYRDASQQLARQHDALRSTAIELNYQQTVALAGEWYRELIHEFAGDPGDPEGWDANIDQIADALAYFVPPDERDQKHGERSPYKPA